MFVLNAQNDCRHIGDNSVQPVIEYRSICNRCLYPLAIRIPVLGQNLDACVEFELLPVESHVQVDPLWSVHVGALQEEGKLVHNSGDR